MSNFKPARLLYSRQPTATCDQPPYSFTLALEGFSNRLRTTKPSSNKISDFRSCSRSWNGVSFCPEVGRYGPKVYLPTSPPSHLSPLQRSWHTQRSIRSRYEPMHHLPLAASFQNLLRCAAFTYAALASCRISRTALTRLLMQQCETA